MVLTRQRRPASAALALLAGLGLGGCTDTTQSSASPAERREVVKSMETDAKRIATVHEALFLADPAAVASPVTLEPEASVIRGGERFETAPGNTVTVIPTGADFCVTVSNSLVPEAVYYDTRQGFVETPPTDCI
ncbi:MAG TPA: hypothetical protein VJ820_21015 [Propionibacteriaceae bacterium]|nr:hypothetical protein [Propionibacteriaceae bacterium]